jgi:class I fructose-bisphosphate aldolase
VSNGKVIRMSRLFADDRKAMILPVDHGINLGRVEGLEQPWSLLGQAATLGCDGVLMTLGVAERSGELFRLSSSPVRILGLDSMQVSEINKVTMCANVATPADAIREACDIVKILMPWDENYEQRIRITEHVASVVAAAGPFELPVMVEPVVTYTRDYSQVQDAEIDGARVAMELGADIIKMRFHGDDGLLRRVCDELKTPVVILGGAFSLSTIQVLESVARSLDAGAAGIAIGRNVWQRPERTRDVLLEVLVELVHGEITLSEAIKRVKKQCAEEAIQEAHRGNE